MGEVRVAALIGGNVTAACVDFATRPCVAAIRLTDHVAAVIVDVLAGESAAHLLRHAQAVCVVDVAGGRVHGQDAALRVVGVRMTIVVQHVARYVVGRWRRSPRSIIDGNPGAGRVIPTPGRRSLCGGEWFSGGLDRRQEPRQPRILRLRSGRQVLLGGRVEVRGSRVSNTGRPGAPAFLSESGF